MFSALDYSETGTCPGTIALAGCIGISNITARMFLSKAITTSPFLVNGKHDF